MARFRCRACGGEGTFAYDRRHDCPACGSPEVQFAIEIEEFEDDDRFVASMMEMTAQDDEPDED